MILHVVLKQFDFQIFGGSVYNQMSHNYLSFQSRVHFTIMEEYLCHNF